MPCKELVVCRPAWKSMTLCVCVLLFNVLSVNASYDFTIRFYEFRNPLGLQCDECGSDGGLPACCDDVQRRENCNMTRPFTCDTRFRFLLRPFGSSLETAPDTGFPHFTQSNTGNSDTFSEGPAGLLTLPNPFDIPMSTPWPGRIQFFIDALDRAVAMSTSGISETLAIINRFPIDLELDPGTNFTERTTYTGFYNISGLGFDMSFRVQCAENFFGPNCCPEQNFFGPSCSVFCMPLEGVYTCDREGREVCLHDNGSRNPSTNCSTCLQGWDLTTNCSTCSLYYDEQSQCTQCVTGRDISTNCTTCLPGYDPSTNCTQCLDLGLNPESNCTGSTNLTTTVSSYTTTNPESTTEHSEGGGDSTDGEAGGLNLSIVGGAVGGAIAALLVAVLAITLCILILVVSRRRRKKERHFSDASRGNAVTVGTFTYKENPSPYPTPKHDFENPLYGSSTLTPRRASNPSAETKHPIQNVLEVPNLHYTQFHDPESELEIKSMQGSEAVMDEGVMRLRLDTFPYSMDGYVMDNATESKSNTMQPARERVTPIVYEDTTIVSMPTATNKTSTNRALSRVPYDDIVIHGTVAVDDLYDDIKATPQSPELYDDIMSGKNASLEAQYDQVGKGAGGEGTTQPRQDYPTASGEKVQVNTPFDNEVYSEPFSEGLHGSKP